MFLPFLNQRTWNPLSFRSTPTFLKASHDTVLSRFFCHPLFVPVDTPMLLGTSTRQAVICVHGPVVLSSCKSLDFDHLSLGPCCFPSSASVGVQGLPVSARLPPAVAGTSSCSPLRWGRGRSPGRRQDGACFPAGLGPEAGCPVPAVLPWGLQNFQRVVTCRGVGDGWDSSFPYEHFGSALTFSV